MTDVAEIARGLPSDAIAIISNAPDDWRTAFMLGRNHGHRHGATVVRIIKASGLFTNRLRETRHLEYRLTPLGLAVRAHLLTQEQPR